MKNKESTSIGILSIGLNTYWNQFKGLKERLDENRKTIIDHISRDDLKIIDAGMVDDLETGEQAASHFEVHEVDILLVHIATYALSSTLIPLIGRIKVPILLLSLQPSASIDFDRLNAMNDRGLMTGEWLAHCQACALPEIACILNRAQVRYEIISGHLQSEDVWNELDQWIKATSVIHGMKKNRMGILGHYYGGMLDVYTDLRKQSLTFGTHIDFLEMCELHKLREAVTNAELSDKLNELATAFDIDPNCSEYELERAARTSVALDKLVESHNLGSIAYYYEGCNAYENIITSVIPGNTLLIGKGIPVAGECEVKNAQAMKIMSLLGTGGSFSEPYVIDYNDDTILWGHDGPAHYLMAGETVRLVPLPLYHGKPGQGLSIQMSVRPGAVTLLSVCEDEDGIFLLYAEGEAQAGKTMNIGNTNSRYHFACGARSFIDAWSKAGPSHHCAIGIGHIGPIIAKIAMLLGIRSISVC